MGNNLSNAFDNYVNWLVLFFFLTSLNLILEATAFLVNEVNGTSLHAWAQWFSRGGSIAILVAFVVWLPKVRRYQKQKGRRVFFDEFVTEAIKRSAFVAFIITLCLVALLDIATNTSELPADFFIKLPGISLCAGFSISFFLIHLQNSAGELEKGQEE